MKTKLLYVERKSGFSDDGPAWIGRGSFSKSGRTIYFNGQAFQSMKGAGIAANHYDLETAEEYLISGVKKSESNRHWAGRGLIQIDREVVEEFLALTGREKLNLNEFKRIEFSKEDVKSRINQGQNQTLSGPAQ
tara:strand:+ start:438 stop:839 length:402 start_codon:yes stop_codon:yes gene_type:complete